MKKILLTLLIGLFLIGNILALDDMGTGKQNNNFTINQICDDATYVTLSTVQYPDRHIETINVNMTSTGNGAYQYNLTNTSLIGRYDITQVSDGCEGTFATYFEITPSGTAQTTSQGIGSMVFLVLMVTLMFVFGFIGFKLSKSEYWWVLGIFFMFLSFLLLVYNTWLGYEYHRNLTNLGDSSIPEIIFYTFLLILVLGLLTSLVLLFLHWKKVFKYVKREIKQRKESEEVEDWDLDEKRGGQPYGK